jgi:hypothetical protein
MRTNVVCPPADGPKQTSPRLVTVWKIAAPGILEHLPRAGAVRVADARGDFLPAERAVLERLDDVRAQRLDRPCVQPAAREPAERVTPALGREPET